MRAAPGVLTRAFMDEVLLARVHHAGTDRLSGAAAAIWLALQDGRTVGDVARLMCEAHGVDPGQLERDIEAFVMDLESRGWIEPI